MIQNLLRNPVRLANAKQLASVNSDNSSSNSKSYPVHSL